MNPASFGRVVMAFGAAWILAGCSPQGGPAVPDAQSQAQADAANANTNLETYRQLLRIHNDEMAVTMGKDIVKRFPDSAAAREVQQTLPEIDKRYTQTREKNRLAALWVYQVAPMAGGTQSTASIRNSEPAGAEPVQLVLRRHTKWGQNVFLYGSGHGFVCRGNCTLPVTVDGKAIRIKAFAPSTGEPALMIRDDKALLTLLAKAHRIVIDVTLVDGEKKQSLVYEVGGFDPAKWIALPGTKKAR
ncbi:MAG: hypothetical protein ABI300_04895 [Rhodanobacter sp.]